MSRFDLRALASRSVRSARRVRLRRPAVTAAGAALVTFLLMPGAGTDALWNGVAAAKAGAITAATVSVSVTIAQPFDTVFKTGHTTTTGGVVVTNTGDVDTSFGSALTLLAGTSAGLASAIGVTVWPAAGAASCTPTATAPAGSDTGTLAALGPTSGALPAGAAAAFCIRETMNVASAPGIASGSAVNVAFSATVTAGTTWSSSASATFAQTFVDDIAPTAPTLALTGSTGSSASLAFAATDNVGVSGYTVYRDGTAIATVGGASTTYTDAGLTVGLHSYTVTASDAAGAVSAASAPVSVAGSYRTGTWYQLVNAASGQCVTVPSAIANGSVLTQSACAAPVNDAQAWLLSTSSGTTVTVTSALPTPASNQYLWVGSRTAPVTVTSSRTITNGSNEWTFTLQADGSFTLGNTIVGNNGNGNGNISTLCATAAAAGGGQLTTATCTAGARTQSFFLRQVTP